MRVVFFGTPTFALPTLERLLTSSTSEGSPCFEVAAVISQPDRPSGRGKRLQPTPVKTLAQAYGIPVYQPQRLRKDAQVLDDLQSLKADVFVVVAYGQILPQQVLDMPRLGCVNVHGSLLPAYRGAAPIQWAIANGETETGITTMLMDAGMDTGAMLLTARVPISPTQTATELSGILAPLGAHLLVETLGQLHRGSLTPIPQDEAQATYAPLLSKEDFDLHWNRPALELHNRIRGFYPYCFTSFRGERLKVLASDPPDDWQQDPSPPGAILEILKHQGLRVQTGQGSLTLVALQAAGKRPQSGWDFANGLRVQVGEKLGDPSP